MHRHHRRFHLNRLVDHSGSSGIGVVAEGTEFTDRTAALRWLGENVSTAVWGSVESLLAVHGHGGDTVVVWLDPEPETAAEATEAAAA